MKQVPDSLLAFQHMFPDDDACAAWLIEMRWPDGFVCPACGHEKGWALRRKAHTFECAGCRRQTSVTAGTILHASKLPLTVWFWAAYLMATHSNGISALQLQKQLGIGSYRSAWLLAHKLRASMVDPERNSLSGLVEIDEASLPFRTKDDPPTGGQGRSHDGKMLIVGAIELGDGNIPGRLRLAEISSYGAADLGHFVETAADPDAIAKTDGWSGYAAVPPIATMSMSSGRPPLTSSCRGSTKSSPTSKDGREASTTGCVASICRPISMSSSFASTAAKPATLLSARSSASPPMQNPLPTAC